MAGRRRTAARLADVADVEMGLAGRPHLGAERRDGVDHPGLAPVAVAADPDRLVARAVERQLLGSLQAACAVEADRLRRTWGGRRHGGPVRAATKEACEQRNDETLHLVARVPAR